MGFTSELILTNAEITEEMWQRLIEKISSYNGLLKKWELNIIYEDEKIKYYLSTKVQLPPTINELEGFLFKACNDKQFKKELLKAPYYPIYGKNLIDLINYTEIKNKGTIKRVQLIFNKIYEGKIKSKEYIYQKIGNKLTKKRLVFTSPLHILKVDLAKQKRFTFSAVPKYLDITKVLPSLSDNEANAMMEVDAFPYTQNTYYLNHNSYNFDKHSLILGSSGSGKSKLISLFINNLKNNPTLAENYRIVVIDPHASLENDIGRYSKVIDFKTLEDSLDLFKSSTKDYVANTENLLSLFKNLLADSYNSKLERILRHTIYLSLVSDSLNFNNLKQLILDTEYRNNLISSLKEVLPSSIINFFLTEFNDIKTKSYSEAISPIISFIDEMQMLPMFSEEQNTSSLASLIENNFITLFSLDRLFLGQSITKTISGLIMIQLFSLAQANIFNKKLIFIVDEVPVIENSILTNFLAEARKYKTSLILCAQHFSQISDSLKDSIFANIINYYVFRISRSDANLLCDNLNIKIPLDNSRERKINILSELNNRECIVKISSNDKLLPAFKAKTLNFEPQPRIRFFKQSNEIAITPKKENKQKKFKLNNISLKDILKANSTSRKELRNE